MIQCLQPGRRYLRVAAGTELTDRVVVVGAVGSFPVRVEAESGASGSRDARGTGQRRVVELDGVRGLAALGVMCGHWLVAAPASAPGPVNGVVMGALNVFGHTPLVAVVAGS